MRCRCRSLAVSIHFSCFAGLLIAGHAHAEPPRGIQFDDQQSTRFPQPAATDFSNQLSIGDLDGDGDLDIVFANGGNFSSPGSPQVQRVYINNGAAVFTDESEARLDFSGLCRGVEMGDIDNDGDLDLIFAQDFNRQPQLFVNNGAGVFSNVTAGQLPAMTLSSSRAQFGDIDNDGDLDIYILSGTTSRFTCGQYRIYVNDGTGTFTDETASRHPLGNVCNNMDCIFADIDGDFDLDVRTGSTGTNNSRLYENDGTGVYAQVAGVPSDSTCYSYDFGDLNGDGDLDMIGVNAGTGSRELLLGNDGTGSFTNISSQLSPNPNQDDNDSKFFDYDNDGDLDLIIARLGSGGEKIYNNDGDGNLTQVANIEIISDSSLDIGVADLDNDGDLDIVTAQGESGSYVNRIYINNGLADTIAPRIIDTEQVEKGNGKQPYVVRASVLDDMSSDRNFFDNGIELHYTSNGRDEQIVAMRHSGGQIYRAEIPADVTGTVEYWVAATDWAGNTGIGASRSFTASFVQGDFDEDGVIDVQDLLQLLAAWGPCPGCIEDIDMSGTVDTVDLLVVLGNWG